MKNRSLHFTKKIEDNNVIKFSELNMTLEQTDACSFILNGAHPVTVRQEDDLYSITFLYNVKNIVSDNDFDVFLSTIFPDVTHYSKDIMDSIKIIHTMIIENLKKLILFTENLLNHDYCKGSVTIVIDTKTNNFVNLVMTGLLSCHFNDKSSCFYNIKYSYGHINDFCFILSRNMVSKTLTKFSNNGFICLIDAKMSDVFNDIYVDYTKEELNNVKMLHRMISI